MCLRGAPLAAAVALACAAALATAGCGSLSRGELERGVQSLGAQAATGRLLADGVARDRTKATYVRVMARTLGEQAQHEAEKLADATPANERVGALRDRAVELAGRLAEQFSQLQTFPGEERAGAEALAAMHRLQDEADALDSALGSERP